MIRKAMQFGIVLMGVAALCWAQTLPEAEEKLQPLTGTAADAARTSPFSVSARLDPPEARPGSAAFAVIEFSCAPEHYIYSSSISVDFRSKGVDGAEVSAGGLQLPEAKSKYDEFLEKRVEYLDEEFAVRKQLSIGEKAAPGVYNLNLQVGYQGCGPTLCYTPKRVDTEVTLTILPPDSEVAAPGRQPGPSEPVLLETYGQELPPSGEEPAEGALQERGLAASLLIAFLGGIALAFTPCVYPIIMVTLSVIGAASGQSKLSGFTRSLSYVLGISITYSILGVTAAATGGIFGGWAQHPVFYLVLAAVFVVLALSMLEVFAIQFTPSWVQRLQVKLRGRGGLIGIMLLGLLSGVVVAPCVAPVVVGVMGYVFQTGDKLVGLLMFFALAWGMGVPLIAVGTFAGIARALPRSGQWMEGVKKFFALCLVGAALYFVSLSGLIPSLVFRMVVAVFLVVVGVFVGALDRLSPESGQLLRAKKAGGLLILAAALAVLFSPLLRSSERTEGIAWISSEQQALELASSEGKPVMLDFSADWCAPCVKMSKTTFLTPAVVEESARFVSVKVDVTDPDSQEARRLVAKYGVVGVPTIIFLTSEGKIARELTIMQYVGPQKLLRAMQAVR